MVKVDIFRNSKEGYDILLLDAERYLSSIEFDFLVCYLSSHVSDSISKLWDWDANDKDLLHCLSYQGIAVRLIGQIHDRQAAKEELLFVFQEALDILDA